MMVMRDPRNITDGDDFISFICILLSNTGWLHQWANTVFRGGPEYNF